MEKMTWPEHGRPGTLRRDEGYLVIAENNARLQVLGYYSTKQEALTKAETSHGPDRRNVFVLNGVFAIMTTHQVGGG